MRRQKLYGLKNPCLIIRALNIGIIGEEKNPYIMSDCKCKMHGNSNYFVTLKCNNKSIIGEVKNPW